jgi:hypothetical protein
MGAFVFVGGGFSSIGGEWCQNIAGIDRDTGAAIANAMMRADDDVRTIALAGEILYVGGEFSSAGGVARNGMAAFDLQSGFLTGWNPLALSSTYPSTRKLIAGDDVIYASGDFYSIGGHQRNGLAALHPETGEPTSWNPRGNGSAAILGVRDSTVFVAGSFTEIGGEMRSGLAALDIETGAATPWDPHAVGSTSAGLAAEDFLYVAGDYSQIGGKSNVHIARLDYATGAATDWSPDLSPGWFYSMAILDSTLYVGGSGYARAVYIPTALTTEWNVNPVPAVPIYAIAPRASTVYLGGGYSSIIQDYSYFVAVPADTSRPMPPPPPPPPPPDGPDGADGPDLSLAISPNPASLHAEIYFSIPADGEVDLDILDVAGRKVGSLVQGRAVAGAHHETFDAHQLATGVYVVRLEYNGRPKTRKFVLVQ